MPVEIINTSCDHIVFNWNNETYQFDWREEIKESDPGIVQEIKNGLLDKNLKSANSVRNYLDKRNY